MNQPPKYSFLDSDGHRWVTLAIDIMKENGLVFHRTMRITLPVTYHFSQGYLVDCESVPDEVFRRWPTLESQRKKVRIMLADAKPVPTPGKPADFGSKNNHYDKTGNLSRPAESHKPLFR